MNRRPSPFCTVWLALAAFVAPVRAVSISETEYEGRAQFKVETSSATFFYDRAGGGFSRLFDRAGRDWVSFNVEFIRSSSRAVWSRCSSVFRRLRA